MTRLGIPHVRIAQRLNIHRETISKYVPKNQELFNKIHQDFKGGSSILDIAQKYCVPQPLVWPVILQEKTDQERFKDLNFFKDLFSLMIEHSKPSSRIAFLNADFRDFQGIPAIDEDPENAILLLEYAKLLENCGWKITHLIDCPLSTERFTGNMVSKMQEKRTLGIIRRTLIIGKPNILHKQGV